MTQRARSEFAQALAAVAAERGVDSSIILEGIKLAIIAAYRRDAREHGEEVNEEEVFEAEIDHNSGEAKIFKIEGKKKNDVTPPGFGRIAAQTAGQVIRQKIREAEREAVLSGFEGRVGQLVSGVILRFDGQDVKVDLGKTEAILPHDERVPSERFDSGQRLSFLLKEIRDGVRGKELIVTRRDPVFIKKLFEREVPELASHSVEIRAIARDAGVRTKIAVASKTSGVDPVGSCVGQKGVRVQEVIKEVGGEKIDVIPYLDDPVEFIRAALSPAQNLIIETDKEKKEAKVSAPHDQLSLVIGRDGQNVRLAAELTGYVIDVKGSGLPEGELTEVEKKPADADSASVATSAKGAAVAGKEVVGGDAEGDQPQPKTSQVDQVEEVEKVEEEKEAA